MGITEGLNYDEALTAAGGWGRYQKLIVLISFFSAVPNAYVGFPLAVSQAKVEHHCTYPSEYYNYTTENETIRQQIIATITPLVRNQRHQMVRSSCKIYQRNYSEYHVEDWPLVFPPANDLPVADCQYGISFSLPPAEENVRMKYSMVCNDAWKAVFTASLNSVGLLIGSMIGVTGDWYGRKPMFIAACVGQIVSQILTTISWNFASYCFSILLGGMCSLVNYVAVYVLVTEICAPGWRNFISIVSSVGFSVGYCTLGLLGYLFPYWRSFLGSMVVLSTLIYAPCCWYFPESSRWLAQKGKSDLAIKGLRVIARVNSRPVQFENALKENDHVIISKSNATSSGAIVALRVLFKAGIAKRFCALIYGWFVTSTVYYAIALFSTDFSSDRFLNVFLSGIVDLPAFVITFLLLTHAGRPRTAFLLMSLTGLSSLGLPFIPKDLYALKTILAMIGKGSIGGVFHVWYLLPTEVMPTLQRSSAMSFCSGAGRVGSIIAPYVMYLANTSDIAANAMMGTASLLSALISILWIPETLGVPVPDTAAEARGNKRIYGFKLLANFGTDGARQKKRRDSVKIDETEQML